MQESPFQRGHHDSPEPQNAFVALFDVLGFKERIYRSPLHHVVAEYRTLVSSKREASSIAVMGPSGSSVWSVGTTIFSDTILLWADDSWDGAQTIIESAAYLIAHALKRRWPLRGAIAYGEVVLDRTSRTFVGRPIVDAHVTEQNQQWIGGALHDTVLAHPRFGGRIQHIEDVVRTHVPTKPNKPRPEYALHWGPYATSAVSTIKALASGSSSVGVLRKYAGARAYLRRHCAGMHALS